MTKRVAIYARASLDVSGEGRSVDRQQEACRKLIDLRGWTEVASHVDNSISAYGGKARPGWEAVRSMMRAGQIDVVVAWHLDRITRSMLDLEQLITEAESYGVAVATATGDIDLTTDVGRMVARILAAVARAEVERKAARQKLANAQLAKAGKPWTGGARPFGYTQDQMEVIEEEAEAIRQAAQDALGGKAMRAIAREWEEAGLQSSRASDATAGGWTGRGVRGVLISPRYAGLRSYRGEVIGDGRWPAILDIDTHKELVRKLTDPTRLLHNHKNGRTPANLLTGIAVCEVCERTVNASRLNGHDIYACRPSAHVTPRRAIIDRAVEEELLAVMSSRDRLASLVSADDEDVEKAQATLDQLDSRLEQLVGAYKDGVLDVVGYAAASGELKKAREAAELALRRLDGSGVLEGLDVGTEAVLEQYVGLPLARRRSLIDRYLDVTVRQTGGRRETWDPGKHLTIEIKVPGD